MKRFPFKIDKMGGVFQGTLSNGKKVELCEEGIRKFFVLPRGCKEFDVCILESTDRARVMPDFSCVYTILPVRSVKDNLYLLYLNKDFDFVELPSTDVDIEEWLWEEAAKDPYFSAVKLWVEA